MLILRSLPLQPACFIHAAGSVKKDEAVRLEGMRLTILMFGAVDDDRMGMAGRTLHQHKSIREVKREKNILEMKS
jgi:hypothetical protein